MLQYFDQLHNISADMQVTVVKLGLAQTRQ